MAKDQFEESNLHVTSNEEVLEISSTGYGLESVSKNTAEKQKFQKSNNTDPSGCGGL